jgi:hypothetical protein
MKNPEPMASWIVPTTFVAIAATTWVMGYHLSHTHPAAAAIGVLLLTAGLGGWYMTLRRRGDLSTQRTVRLLMMVMLVVVFGGRYLVRNW